MVRQEALEVVRGEEGLQSEGQQGRRIAIFLEGGREDGDHQGIDEVLVLAHDVQRGLPPKRRDLGHTVQHDPGRRAEKTIVDGEIGLPVADERLQTEFDAEGELVEPCPDAGLRPVGRFEVAHDPQCSTEVYAGGIAPVRSTIMR